jgi:hypothetical protein
MSQGNSLCSYLKLTKNVILFLYKVREQGDTTHPSWRIGTSGRGEGVGERHSKVTIVQILCSHVCKWKNIPVETVPGMGGKRIMENDERMTSSTIYYKKFCKYHNVPQAQQ